MLSRQDDESILLMFSPIPRIDWSTGRGKRVNHAETIQGQAFGSPQDRSETIAAGLRPFTNGLAAAGLNGAVYHKKPIFLAFSENASCCAFAMTANREAF